MPTIQPSTPYDYSATPQGTSPTPSQPDNQEKANQTARNIRSIVSTVALFLAAPLLALVLILFVIQSYEVDGPSMEQTLHNKDLLIVTKVPKTVARITGKPYIPPRGQIIIFSRDEGGAGQSRQLVKRVIALPGERVSVKDGTVTVYNQANPEGFRPDKDKEYSKTITNTPGNVDLTVQPGEVFVLGDNRTNSLDSRYFGPVNANDIVGKLGVRIFPLNKAQTF